MKSSSPVNKSARLIMRGDAFDMALLAFLSDENKPFRDYISEKRYTVQDVDNASYRAINHWCSHGLLNDEREKESQKWRRLSIVDMTWLHIIKELREYGLPLKKIYRAKKTLFYVGEGKEKRRFPMLNLYIWEACLRKPIYILAFNDGQCEPLSKQQFDSHEKLGLLGSSFLIINLNDIISKTVEIKEITPIYGYGSMLGKISEKELGLLAMIRSKKLDRVEIKFKNGKIERIDGTQKINVKKRIIDILNENKYQGITVKQANGKVVSIQRTIQKIPDINDSLRTILATGN